MDNKAPLLIDIDKVLHNKMGKKSRFVPRFLVSYLKKIIHQDEMNDFLSNGGRDKEGVEFVGAFLAYLGNHFEVSGEENLPAQGACTFVSNHPLGGPDGLGLGLILGRHYGGHVKYLVNDLLMNIAPLAPLFVPINKTGSQSKDSILRVEKAFSSPDHLIMFPAGICSRRHGGIIRDLEWKKAFVVKSVQYKRNVVPIHFEGANSDFFYRLANLNKALHIKFNFAMLYLSDEMFKNRGKTFKVTIGKPIPWETFNSSQSPARWAAYVQDIVYKL